MSQVKIYKKLDLSGNSCAGPLGELSGVYEELKEGEGIEVILGDEGTKKDISAWAKKVGAKIINEKSDGNKFVLVVAKGV